MYRTIILFAGLLLTAAAIAMTAADYVRTLPAPHFAVGHSMPKLSKWSWPLPVDLRIELSARWGYALEVSVADIAPAQIDKELANPDSETSRLCALAASDPATYALGVTTPRSFPSPIPDTAWTHDATGALVNGSKLWSPEAPDSIFQSAAATWATQVAKIRARAPIAIVLNGGEYGLPVVAGGVNAWRLDPKVVAAKGNRDWWSYISERKAHQELISAQAFRAAIPDRQLYIYYVTSSGFARNRWGGWKNYSFGYQWINTIGDLPSEQMYYGSMNDGWVMTTLAGDGLTEALNSVGEAITYGNQLSYNWVSGGWTQAVRADKGFSDIPRYMGFLKCYYTAGMIGGVASYCEYPTGGFGADVDTTAPPHWLQQMIALSEVHALFSYLEPFLRQGYLLPGPNKHIWSKTQPAYEFPTGSPGTRVLVRKMRLSNDWIMTAWAADGNERDVTVTIPILGSITLFARSAGSVYHVKLAGGNITVDLLDADSLHPSATF